MSDWLEGLREEKNKVLGQTIIEAIQEQAQRESTKARLRTEQEFIKAIFQNVEIEASLRQLMDEIIRGHPAFPNPHLYRTDNLSWGKVFYQEWESKPPHWNNEDPIREIEWTLVLTQTRLDSRFVERIGFNVSLSAHGLRVNNQPLSSTTTQGLRDVIVEAFRNSILWVVYA